MTLNFRHLRSKIVRNTASRLRGMFAVAAGGRFAACWRTVNHRLPLTLLITGLLCACGAKPPAAEADTASAPPANPVLLLDGALDDFQRDDMDQALVKLEALEKSNDVSPMVFNMLGAVWTKKKDYPKAEGYFSRALDMDPTFFPARFNRGEILFLEKKYPEALEYFSDLQMNVPNYDLLQFKVYLCNLLLNNTDAAQAMLEKIKSYNDSPAWYYAQAAWEITHDNPGKAKKYLRNASVLFEDKNKIFNETFSDLGWPTP